MFNFVYLLYIGGVCVSRQATSHILKPIILMLGKLEIIFVVIEVNCWYPSAAR